MGLELCALPLSMRSYRSAYSIWRSLGYFRRVREELRHLGEPEDSLATLQYVEAAKQAGEDRAQIESVVVEWIHQRPLKYLRLCRRRGMEAFLTFLESKGIQVGVFSDYPVLDKLQALGLAERMSLALWPPIQKSMRLSHIPRDSYMPVRCGGCLQKRCSTSVIAQRLMPLAQRMPACHALFLVREHVVRGSRKPRLNCVTFSSFIRLQHALTSHC